MSWLSEELKKAKKKYDEVIKPGLDLMNPLTQIQSWGQEVEERLGLADAGHRLAENLNQMLGGSAGSSPGPDTETQLAPIEQLISDAEKKRKDEDKEASELAMRVQRQMMSLQDLERSGSFQFKRGGTLLTSPLGLSKTELKSNSLIGQ